MSDGYRHNVRNIGYGTTTEAALSSAESTDDWIVRL